MDAAIMSEKGIWSEGHCDTLLKVQQCLKFQTQ